MKKLIAAFSLLWLADQAQAQPPVELCQNVTTAGVTTCQAISASNPLQITGGGGGSGTVTSVTFTGDGTVLSSTPSSAVTTSGTLTATLATQTANTVLGALTATTPSDLAVPSCSAATSALIWTSGAGFGCHTVGASGAAVNSITGDSTIISNSASTGAVTLTLANAGANSLLGNNTGSGAAPAYQTSFSISGSGTATSFNATTPNTGIQMNGANGISYPSVDSTVDGTIAIGSSAFANPSTSAAYNATVTGYQALSGVLTTAAIKNSAFGFQAGLANTSGHDNTYFGYKAGSTITSGVTNTFVGASAAGTNVGSNETAVGAAAQALGNASTVVGSASKTVNGGNNNTVLGEASFAPDTSVAVGVAIGNNSMTGSGDVMVGNNTGHILTIGSNNTILGNNVGSTTITIGSSNVLIGVSATTTTASAAENNSIHIGAGGADILYTTGGTTNTTANTIAHGVWNMPDLGSSSSATTGTVCWTTSTGLLNVDTTTTCLLSARRFKKDIKDSPFGLAEVMKMKPRTFLYKKNGGDINLKREQVGFIAEEMEQAVPDLVSYEADGKTAKSVAYANLTAVLAKAIQEQQSEIDVLKKQIGKR